MMNHRRMVSWGAAVLALALGGATPAIAQDTDYPNRRVSFFVAFAPGGFADTLARVVAQKLGDRWGQTVVVDNRAGAGGNVAARQVAAAAPDGYTVLVTTTALAINQSLYRKLDYGAGDLLPVAIPASSPETLAIPPASPAGGLADFVARNHDRDINYATAGVGSGSHVAAAYFFKKIAAQRATHVPFRGGVPAIQAVLGQQVDAVMSSFGVVPHVADGRLKGLGVASGQRVAAIPKVPTFIESGYAGFEAVSWVGFFVPARTPSAVVDKLNAAINDIVAEPVTERQLSEAGYHVVRRDAAASGAYLKSEIAAWGGMVRTVGLSVD